MTLPYLVENQGRDKFARGGDLKAVGHQIAFGVEIDILAGAVGKCEDGVPEASRPAIGFLPQDDLLRMSKFDIHGPLARRRYNSRLGCSQADASQ